MCDAHLFGGPLTCTRPDPHATGHIYVSATGSDVDDRHSESGEDY